MSISESLENNSETSSAAFPTCLLYGTWVNFRVEDSQAVGWMVLGFFFVVLFEKVVNGWQQ